MKDDKFIDDLDIDFGNIQLPELDLDIFADGPEDEKQETRYMKPHRPDTWQQHEIMYDNAEKLARDLTLDRGMRANVIVAGSFIFGDFIEAYLTSHNAKAIRMTISTLSLSQENVDSLRTLLEYGYIDQLDMIISAYFFAHERGALIPYMYEQLDIDDRFQLSVCGTHMKTVHFETLGGKKIVIHGSANLRSSANIEQFTIEENPALFDFYEETSQKIIPEGTPAEALKAYTIKDNAGFGEWDFEILANDWDLDQIESWGVDIPDVDLDPEPEEAEEDNFDVESNMPKNPVSKIGDVFQLGRHRLVCGDATIKEHMDALMAGKNADAYITDPPYNVDYSSKNETLNAADKGNRIQKDIAGDKMEDTQFQQFLVDAFTNANDHLRKGGAYYIWHAEWEGYNFRTAALRVGWQLRQTLIWSKNTIVLGRQDYQWKHEPCLYGWKDGASHYFTQDRTQTTIQSDDFDIDKLTKDEMRELLHHILQDMPSTIIEEDKPLRSAEHPTMKPVKLIGRIMKNSTRVTDIILDNFGGSGTTIMAAEQLGRTCYMMELDPAYCDVIIKRWEELTQESAEYIGNFLEDKNTDQKKE